jgi:hypothetical protein
VFAAAFAWAWAVQGQAPVDAARFASRSVAFWAQSPLEEPPLSATAGEDLGELPLGARPRVYLAGPFFDLGQHWVTSLAYQALVGVGAEVFSPLHDVGRGDRSVAKADLAGLEGSAAVLALLDGADPGTLFELGYATHHGLPIIGYAQHFDDEDTKMLVGTGAELHQDLSTAVYRCVWAAMGMRLKEA